MELPWQRTSSAGDDTEGPPSKAAHGCSQETERRHVDVDYLQSKRVLLKIITVVFHAIAVLSQNIARFFLLAVTQGMNCRLLLLLLRLSFLLLLLLVDWLVATSRHRHCLLPLYRLRRLVAERADYCHLLVTIHTFFVWCLPLPPQKMQKFLHFSPVAQT